MVCCKLERLTGLFCSLDEAGYFVISADAQAGEIVAQYFNNTINKAGLPEFCECTVSCESTS